jgi:hypothetical protein
MKDELYVYCKLEGFDEEYLRARLKADKRLLRQESKRVKMSERSGRECGGLECCEEPDNG